VTLSRNLSIHVATVQFRVDNRFIVVLIGRRCDSAISNVWKTHHIGVDEIVVLLSSNYVAVDVNISVSVVIFSISLMPTFFITASHTTRLTRSITLKNDTASFEIYQYEIN